jgi:ParB/RepB/Spo0J family partition protein
LKLATKKERATMEIEEKVKEKSGLDFKDLKRIDVNDIIPNKLNPREKVSRKEVTDIRESIKEVGGILVPLVVYWDEQKGKYVLLDGERRWRAAAELSKYDEKYRTIPANIISGPLKDEENIRTMFNIHMQRKEWSTFAVAKAMGKLMRLDPSSTDTELARKIHVTVQHVKEARLFLRAPKKLRERCLKDDLDEYYLIILIRNLDVCKRLFPELFEKYRFNDLVKKFIDKVDDSLIIRYKDFNFLAQIARKCKEHDERDLFVETFEKMVNEKTFNPNDAIKYVDKKLSYKVASLFTMTCKDFLLSLKSFSGKLAKENQQLPQPAGELLLQIHEELSQLIQKMKLNSP